MDLTIDEMRPGDWEDVRRIYFEGLATGNASFETEAPSRDAWEAKYHTHSRLVARLGGRVVAWAALAPVSPRACYAGVAEVSLYVTDGCRGRGVGKKLMEVLIAASERNGIWSLYGSTFPENEA